MFLSSNDPFKLKRPIVASVYIKTTRFEAWLDFADSSESAISYTKHLKARIEFLMPKKITGDVIFNFC